MNEHDVEIEIKICVRHLESIRWQLKQSGAKQVQGRTFENNLRFDFQDKSLSASHKVLRLRQDQQAILTFKGPAKESEEVSVRQELEVQVSDFERTRALLEALGYFVYAAYEKYRTTYSFKDLLISLDELPYGNFIEIEGPNSEKIQAMVQELGLDWDKRIKMSYLMLFDALKQTYPELNDKQLRFTDLQGFNISPADMNISAADG